MSSACVLFVLAVVFVCGVTRGAVAVNCPDMQYFDRKTNQCAPCSSCPPNKAFYRKCYGVYDTQCGRMPMVQLPNFNVLPNEPEVHSQPTTTPLKISETDKKDKWVTLTMILIVIIVLTCLLGVLAVVVFCFAYRHKQRAFLEESGKQSNTCFSHC